MEGGHAEVLRAHGIQVTAQRLAVLRAVEGRPHCTAEEVLGVVREDIGTISHQGVYDALAVLCGKGVLRRIEPAGSAARYEARVEDNHHHLICRVCGKTQDVDCVVGSAPCLEPASARGMSVRGFVVEEAEVIFWGTCAGCRSAGAGSRPVARGKRGDVNRRGEGRGGSGGVKKGK